MVHERCKVEEKDSVNTEREKRGRMTGKEEERWRSRICKERARRSVGRHVLGVCVCVSPRIYLKASIPSHSINISYPLYFFLC